METEQSVTVASKWDQLPRKEERAEAEAVEKARKDFEEHERIWILTHQKVQLKRQEEIQIQQAQEAAKKEEEENWEYVEDVPAEIIWQGNEINVQKKKIRVPKGKLNVKTDTAHYFPGKMYAKCVQCAKCGKNKHSASFFC
ncbi:hypothetical protein SUGI_0050230 [Cryptomeria japonica]|nr:hypothetical protein SUGI_0050230 [Cryptomeria japonica]